MGSQRKIVKPIKSFKSDKKNQTKRLLTKAQRDLIAEYHRHHPLSKLCFCPDCIAAAGIPSEWGAA